MCGSMTDVVMEEKYGKLGPEIKYVKGNANHKLARLYPPKSVKQSIVNNVQSTFREVFLPQGYPNSVSKDYLDYQIWDTVQAFCSTIMGTLTTQAILKGIGVGDVNAAPLAAAIAWILKDGSGMFGRIIFAWWKGVSLDMDCKKWRLFADILNDLAMLIELTIPYFSHYSTLLLCFTTSMKAIVGVAGGATRASITQHQAIKGNMADVSAKDGSQETCVNLLSSFIGIFLLTAFDDPIYHWLFFIVLTFMHLYSNYCAVTSLILNTVNTSRLILIINQYLGLKKTDITPEIINKKESVFLGFGMTAKSSYDFEVKLGCSINNIAKDKSAIVDFERLVKAYQYKKYLIIPNVTEKTIYVAFEDGETTVDVLSGYFHAVLLGFAIFDHSYTKSKVTLNSDFIIRELQGSNIEGFNVSVENDIRIFIDDLKENGWSFNNHLVKIDEWRAKWKKTL